MSKWKLRTSHTLRLIDSYRNRILIEKKRFIIASGLLLGSAVSSLRRLSIVPFMMTGVLLNFVMVQFFMFMVLGILIIKLNSYRLINSILRARQ